MRGASHGLWYAFGESDVFALIEAPDNVTAAGLAIAVASSGPFRKGRDAPAPHQAGLLESLERASEVADAAPGAAVHA